MITALLIDDEQHCIDRLATLLSEYCATSVRVIGTARSVDEGIGAIRQLRPDLLFLDVELGDKSGFDILSAQGDERPAVIFTTAFERYAVQAFRFSALDYLLKPVDGEDLRMAVGKATERKSREDMAQKIDVLFHNLKTLEGPLKRISVPTINGFVVIHVSDIIRCESDVNYTNIHLKGRRKLTVARTLKEFEELLGEYDFFRVHNSHLINLACVKGYNKGKGGYVSMVDDSEIEVSTRRRSEFIRRIGG